MAQARPDAERPLSPHLQIYKPMLTTMMSIVHRMTGAALYIRTTLLAWWLVAAASGPEHFALINGLAGSIVGKLVLFGYTWALIHHMLGGIRHFIWDTGHGFGLQTIEIMARATIAGSLALTALVWGIAFARGVI